MGESLSPRLDGLCRLVIVFRSLTLGATVLFAAYEREDVPLLGAALVIAALASYLPLRYWPRFAPQLARHPGLLGVDLALSVIILHLAGPQSPFFLYALGTAVLAGALYGRTGAAVFGLLLVAAYASAAAFGTQSTEPLAGFEALVGDPLLFLLSAALGVALRGLLERQAQTEAALAQSGRALAISEERGRMAREMHDSVAKTLEGLALSAAAVEARAHSDPDAAVGQAGRVADIARQAAAEARALIGGLRSEQADGPLEDALREHAERWAQEAGVEATIDVAGVSLPSRAARHEILSIAKEALENVARHAQAERVAVTLASDEEGGAVLSIADDGVGLPDGASIEDVEAGGHYGLLGMSERAERIGARLELVRGPLGGLEVKARLVPAAHGPEVEVGSDRPLHERAMVNGCEDGTPTVAPPSGAAVP